MTSFFALGLSKLKSTSRKSFSAGNLSPLEPASFLKKYQTMKDIPAYEKKYTPVSNVVQKYKDLCAPDAERRAVDIWMQKIMKLEEKSVAEMLFKAADTPSKIEEITNGLTKLNLGMQKSVASKVKVVKSAPIPPLVPAKTKKTIKAKPPTKTNVTQTHAKVEKEEFRCPIKTCKKLFANSTILLAHQNRFGHTLPETSRRSNLSNRGTTHVNKDSSLVINKNRKK